MQEIIGHLEKVVHCTVPFDEKDFSERIDRDSPFLWESDFPVAVVHHRSRMDEMTRKVFEDEEMFETGGYTPECYVPSTLREVSTKAPKGVKKVSFLAMGKEDETYCYRPKREGDKWKKIVDNGTFRATVELSYYSDEHPICQIEAQLRDLMRSSKEIPSLKAVGFVWIAIVPKDYEINRLLEHYFPNEWMKIEEETHTAYIGWHEKLGEINMRYFICPPNNKESK